MKKNKKILNIFFYIRVAVLFVLPFLLMKDALLIHKKAIAIGFELQRFQIKDDYALINFFDSLKFLTMLIVAMLLISVLEYQFADESKKPVKIIL